MAENYKHLYEQTKKMLTMYQDELIPGFRKKIEELEAKVATDNNVGSKWIPVTERLPEVATSHNTRWDKSTASIRVLCACVQADGKKMVKEGYCKVYSDGFVHWKIPGTIHSVTHWQYLPQPPKGE